MKIGDKIYKIDCSGKYLRTIIYVGENHIEWKWGYARKDQLQLNTNKKSKVLYIVDYTK
jgi:hypothetical protein